MRHGGVLYLNSNEFLINLQLGKIRSCGLDDSSHLRNGQKSNLDTNGGHSALNLASVPLNGLTVRDNGCQLGRRKLSSGIKADLDIALVSSLIAISHDLFAGVLNAVHVNNKVLSRK